MSCHRSNGVFKGLGALMWGREHHQSGPISFERSWLTIQHTTHQSSLHSCQTKNPVQNPTSSLLYSFFWKTYIYACSAMFSGNKTRKYRPINRYRGFDQDQLLKINWIRTRPTVGYLLIIALPYSFIQLKLFAMNF
jgi:hypothetical protein